MLNLSYGEHLIKNSFLICKYYVFNTYIHLDRLEIFEEFRGQGFGTRFMKEFLKQVNKSVCLTILEARPLNFYLKLGFEIDCINAEKDGKIIDADLTYIKRKKEK